MSDNQNRNRRTTLESAHCQIDGGDICTDTSLSSHCSSISPCSSSSSSSSDSSSESSSSTFIHSTIRRIIGQSKSNPQQRARSASAAGLSFSGRNNKSDTIEMGRLRYGGCQENRSRCSSLSHLDVSSFIGFGRPSVDESTDISSIPKTRCTREFGGIASRFGGTGKKVYKQVKQSPRLRLQQRAARIFSRNKREPIPQIVSQTSNATSMRRPIGGSSRQGNLSGSRLSHSVSKTIDSDKDSQQEAEDAHELNSKWSWRNLMYEFKLAHSENLFHIYQAKLQHGFFVALLILNIILNLGACMSHIVSTSHILVPYIILMRFASIVVFILFLILIYHSKLWIHSKSSRTVASLAVLLAMIFGEASGAICSLVNAGPTSLALMRRTYYLIITNHVFLPFPSRIQSFGATIFIASLEIFITYKSRVENNCKVEDLVYYSSADIIFYMSSAMIGFQITFLLDLAIRRTFLNHRYCIQSTYKLNYEKEQQEQLLGSCFPQHLIEQIRDEIRESIALISKRQSIPYKPFYNLYVEKFDNVSILYADMVNSMNLTDKLAPNELVETLNELYGRFDESADKNNCLRIKLLGDCYYCVSGLPDYDEKHALNCVLMGLEMIKIINSIRLHRCVDIDMRIGIHSGSVLSGLLGLRKWQFDIWSIDAMKASRMEHSGQPGFVHVTQTTVELLYKHPAVQVDLIITATRQQADDETTYLISERQSNRVNVSGDCSSPVSRRRGQTEKLKAYIEKLRVRSSHDDAVNFAQRRLAMESSLKKYREMHAMVDETMKSAIANMPLGSAWKQFFYLNWLGKRSSDSQNHAATHELDATGAPLDSKRATSGQQQQQQQQQPKNASNCGPNKQRQRKQRRRKRRNRIANNNSGHKYTDDEEDGNDNDDNDNDDIKRRPSGVASTHGRRAVKSALEHSDPLFHLYLICVLLITVSILAIKCLIPRMRIYLHTQLGFGFLICIIVAAAIFTHARKRRINVQFRVLLWLIISASLIMLQLVDLLVPTGIENFELQQLFQSQPQPQPQQSQPQQQHHYKPNSSHETEPDRCAFTWHPSCAVIFASIPNYESFYTENNLNESGLKCLQLLNEIICDFDQLLSHPDFSKVEKIKTIGSTYMAACFEDSAAETGNSGNAFKRSLALESLDEEIETRPQLQLPVITDRHKLADDDNRSHEIDNEAECVTMVCFAMALMESLQHINRDAFQDFKLRVGIAVGPVIAGVVGASKPTYDIWGDTVNVASRLESSGVMGRIQVSEAVAMTIQRCGAFQVECRGPVEVKGKRVLTTYLVRSPFDHAADAVECLASGTGGPSGGSAGSLGVVGAPSRSVQVDIPQRRPSSSPSRSPSVAAVSSAESRRQSNTNTSQATIETQNDNDTQTFSIRL